MKYIQEPCGILSITEIASGFFDLSVKNGQMAVLATCGQFVNIRCDGKTLRRPISICEVDKEKGSLRLVFEVRGEGTLWLSTVQVGQSLDILGPLGKGYTVAAKPLNAVLIGGGIGTPPLLQTVKEIGNTADIILGFRNKNAVILENDFKNVSNSVSIATDDGSYGHHGFVTDLLLKRLADKPCDMIYACGPTPMLKAITKIAIDHNIPCEISMEERMGCGIGACLSCACKVEMMGKPTYTHVCKTGPVFDARKVDFGG